MRTVSGIQQQARQVPTRDVPAWLVLVCGGTDVLNPFEQCCVTTQTQEQEHIGDLSHQADDMW